MLLALWLSSVYQGKWPKLCTSAGDNCPHWTLLCLDSSDNDDEGTDDDNLCLERWTTALMRAAMSFNRPLITVIITYISMRCTWLSQMNSSFEMTIFASAVLATVLEILFTRSTSTLIGNLFQTALSFERAANCNSFRLLKYFIASPRNTATRQEV